MVVVASAEPMTESVVDGASTVLAVFGVKFLVMFFLRSVRLCVDMAMVSKRCQWIATCWTTTNEAMLRCCYIQTAMLGPVAAVSLCIFVQLSRALHSQFVFDAQGFLNADNMEVTMSLLLFPQVQWKRR